MNKSYLTITDQFCGAGGSSQGARNAGFEVALAMNHWKLAVETHNTNFPQTLHDCADISASDPRRYSSTDVLITSPECVNHTNAKGKKRATGQLDMFAPAKIDPTAERSRATMFDVPRFAEYHNYRVIVVENVVEAMGWVMWPAWLQAMNLLGYEHQFVFFNSQFAPPTPQSRDRMYVVFHKRGNNVPNLKFCPPAWCAPCDKQIESIQSWKNPLRAFGRYKQQYLYRCPHCAQEVRPYYSPASTAINWTIAAQTIKDRAKPLKEKTLKRIELGLKTLGSSEALIMGTAYSHAVNNRAWPVSSPMFTQTTQSGTALVTPPLRITTSHSFSMGNVIRSMNDRMFPQTTCQDRELVTPPNPFLVSYYGTSQPHPLSDPMGTLTTHDRHGLAVPGQSVEVEDCGFRMITPPEVQAAMAFPANYVVLGSGRDKVKQLGNAVTPPVMEMIMRRVMESFN